MQFRLEKLILQTKSVAVLAQFITSLFDAPPHVDEQGFTYFEIGSMRLYLAESELQNLNSNVNLSFWVDDFLFIEDFKMKLQFYNYREENNCEFNIECFEQIQKITFKDPDKRTWIIESPIQLSSQLEI